MVGRLLRHVHGPGTRTPPYLRPRWGTADFGAQAFFGTLGDDYQSVGARLFKGGRFNSGRDQDDIQALERHIRLQQQPAQEATRWGVF